MALISKTSAVFAILVIAAFLDCFVHGRCYNPELRFYVDNPSVGCVIKDKNETTGCPGGLRRYDSFQINACNIEDSLICCQIAQVVEEKKPSQNNGRNVAANEPWNEFKDTLFKQSIV